MQQVKQEFKTSLDKLNQFIQVQSASATEHTRRELGRVNAMLGQIGQEHQQYQQQVAWMVEAIKGNQTPIETSVITQVSKQEKALRTELLAMRDEVQLFTQRSADAVDKHETLVIQETTVFTLFVFSLGAAMLFFIGKVIAARDEAINEITYHATFDSLTKLHNRRYFNERFDQAIKAATRHGQPLSLCFVT
jgi:predicted signal transduction protein with EAL and GGDEF domain